MSSVEIKQQLAEKFVDGYTEKLKGFEYVVLSWLQKKLVELMTGADELSDKVENVKIGRFTEQLIKLFPEEAQKIYDDFKKKKKEIAEANTSNELENLQARIEGKPEPHPAGSEVTTSWTAVSPTQEKAPATVSSPTAGGQTKLPSGVIAVWGGLVSWGVSTAAGIAAIEHSKPVIETTGERGQTKESFESSATYLRDLLKNPKLGSIEKEAIEHNAKLFDEAAAGLDETTGDALKARQKIGMDKLSPETLKSLGLKSEGFVGLRTIAADRNLSQAILDAKSVSEAEALLKARKIEGITPEVLGLLRGSKDVESLANMSKVLANSRSLTQVARGLFAANVFDVACFGMDIYLYCETLNQADIIKKVNEKRGEIMHNQANAHLATATGVFMGSLALTAFAACASSGPPWRVIGLAGVAIGTGGALVDHVIDTNYYDIKNFYFQNYEEDKKKLSIDLRQSVIQVIQGINSGSVTVNDPISTAFSPLLWPILVSLNYRIDKTVTEQVKFTCLDDLLKAMIYLEVVDNGDYPLLSKLNTLGQSEKDVEPKDKAQYDTETKALTMVIDTRLTYIRAALPGHTNDPKAEKFLNGKWMAALDTVLASSRAVSDKASPDAYATGTTTEEYLKNYEAKLVQENPEGYKKLTALAKNNPQQYELLLSGAKSYGTTFADALAAHPENSDYKKESEALEYRKKFDRYLEYTRTTTKNSSYLNYASVDYDHHYIEQYLLTLDSTTTPNQPTRDQKTVFDALSRDHLSNYPTGLSDNPFQNILYRIARETYHADVTNDRESLIGFYQEGRADMLGVSYGKKWFWGAQKWITNKDYGRDKSISTEDFKTLSATELMGRYFGLDMIHTPAHNADKALNQEMYNSFDQIVHQELGLRTEAHQQEIKTKVENYITQHAKDGYLELPYTLSQEAIRAGLGHVERFFYSVKDGKISALALWSDVDTPLKLSVQKEATTILRPTLTEAEKKYIASVESEIKKLNTLLSKPGTWSDEGDLDLSREHQEIIRQKIKDRESVVHKLPYLQAATGQQLAEVSAQNYGEWFDHMRTGLLVESTNGHTSNDVDTSEKLEATLAFAKGNFYTIENKKIVLSEKISMPYGLKDAVKKFIDTKKMAEGKTIKDLLLSDSTLDQTLGKWYITELVSVGVNSSLSESFMIPQEGGYLDEERVFKKFDEVTKSPPAYLSSSAFDERQQTKEYDTRSVRQLVGPEVALGEAAQTVTEGLEKTNLAITRQGRKDIVLNHQNNTIESRSEAVPLTSDGKSLKGLENIARKNTAEMLWVANFINRSKNYRKTHDDVALYRGSRGLGISEGVYAASEYLDTKIIDAQTLKEHAPDLFDSSGVLKNDFEKLLKA